MIESVTPIYEDEFVVAVNKPAGLMVHGDGRTMEPTLVDWVLKNYPYIKDVGEPARSQTGAPIPRPGIVHRIDRDTSGVLVVAKTQKTFLSLKQQFQGRHVKKEYSAFVYGTPKEREGVIDNPIGRSPKDFRQYSSFANAKGGLREAVTAYTVLETNGDFSFLNVRPKTGRTHQIRVHLKTIGHPIVCDRLYAAKRPCALGFERLALHARTLTLTLPDNCTITIEAPLPADFEHALNVLRA